MSAFQASWGLPCVSFAREKASPGLLRSLRGCFPREKEVNLHGPHLSCESSVRNLTPHTCSQRRRPRLRDEAMCQGQMASELQRQICQVLLPVLFVACRESSSEQTGRAVTQVQARVAVEIRTGVMSALSVT